MAHEELEAAKKAREEAEHVAEIARSTAEQEKMAILAEVSTNEAHKVLPPLGKTLDKRLQPVMDRTIGALASLRSPNQRG